LSNFLNLLDDKIFLRLYHISGGDFVNYKDYKKSRDTAWQILIDLGICELPVKVSVVCRQIGVPVKMATLDGVGGEVRMIRNRPYILVEERDEPARQKFTAAHELGHIILGHVGKYELITRDPSPGDNPIEQAANSFAARLLSPACVLWGCHVRSAEDIAELCQISLPAARYRWQRMQLLYKRGKFLTHPLERKVFEQFREFIEGISRQHDASELDGIQDSRPHLL
jgi:Zn-dependent peptidase ImmA (M78 family)